MNIFQEKNLNSDLYLTSENPESIESVHNEHLWLLILDLLVFVGLTFTAYSSSKKMEATTMNPDDFRPKFIKGLIYANGSKFIKVIFFISKSFVFGYNNYFR